MSLVDYPDSDSDESDQAHAANTQPVVIPSKSAAKRKRSEAASDALPPLPATFHDLYATNARVGTNDDPSLHGGRKRAIPHVQGNWPSHVYLEWIPSQTESNKLHQLIRYVKDSLDNFNAQRIKKLVVPDITPSLQSDLGAPLPLHVSLSRTLQIKTEDRADFVAALTSSLKAVAVRAFSFQFHGLKWVSNFERNRWFLVLGMKKPAHDELNRLLNACNKAAEKTGHPGLYVGGEGDGPMKNNDRDNKASAAEHDAHKEVDRSEFFHISIAWNLDEPNVDLIALVEDIDIREHIDSPSAPIDAVKAKVGNTIHSIALGAQR